MTEESFNLSISKILAGDKSGLREIYDAYMAYIYQVVLGIVGRREDAEDITSDFFIKLWQSADKYKPGTGHKGYMATMARNMAIDHLRKHKKEILDDFANSDEGEVSISEPVSKDNTEAEVIDEISLNDALNRLNPAERLVVDMKVLSEMTFAQIAEALRIPMGTVTWRYKKAIEKLRRCGYYEGD